MTDTQTTLAVGTGEAAAQTAGQGVILTSYANRTALTAAMLVSGITLNAGIADAMIVYGSTGQTAITAYWNPSTPASAGTGYALSSANLVSGTRYTPSVRIYESRGKGLDAGPYAGAWSRYTAVNAVVLPYFMDDFLTVGNMSSSYWWSPSGNNAMTGSVMTITAPGVLSLMVGGAVAGSSSLTNTSKLSQAIVNNHMLSVTPASIPTFTTGNDLSLQMNINIHNDYSKIINAFINHNTSTGNYDMYLYNGTTSSAIYSMSTLQEVVFMVTAGDPNARLKVGGTVVATLAHGMTIPTGTSLDSSLAILSIAGVTLRTITVSRFCVTGN